MLVFSDLFKNKEDIAKEKANIEAAFEKYKPLFEESDRKQAEIEANTAINRYHEEQWKRICGEEPTIPTPTSEKPNEPSLFNRVTTKLCGVFNREAIGKILNKASISTIFNKEAKKYSPKVLRDLKRMHETGLAISGV